jgi:hypothetical protein
MELSQGNSLYSYLKQTKILWCFLQDQRIGVGRMYLAWGVGTRMRWKNVGRGYRRVNMLPVFCTYVYKWKNETC